MLHDDIDSATGRSDETYEFPCSHAQVSLWLADQVRTGASGYVVPAKVRLAGSLDAQALRCAFHDLVDRHEVLRTTFELSGLEPVQVVHAALAPEYQFADLSDLVAGDRSAALATLEGEALRRAFDLTRGPLLRIVLVRMTRSEHVLLVTLHHIIVDGWSVGILMAELAVCYQARMDGARPELPELPYQYADFAVWHRELLSGGELDRQADYWRAVLDPPVPALDLPTDYPRPAQPSGRGWHLTSQLSPELSAALDELAARSSATPFMILTAAFGRLLHSYAGTRQVVIGAAFGDRALPETESLVGYFVSVLPILVGGPDTASFGALQAQVRAAILGAAAHRDIPPGRLASLLREGTDTDTAPFRTMIAWQNALDEPFALPGLTAEMVELESGTAKYDLTLLASRSARGFRLTLEGDADLFERQTGNLMLTELVRLLESVAGKPGGPDQTATTSRIRGPAGRLATTVIDLVDRYAASTPGAIAAREGTATLTYAELASGSGRLAGALRDAGVRPGDLVALPLSLSLSALTAIFAVWKAGGAFVPIDQSLPAARQRQILDAATPAFELTAQRLTDMLARASADPPVMASVEPDAMAYTLFTSGSTGDPKGVMIPHRGLAQYLAWAVAEYRLSASDSAPVHSPLGFDLTLTSLLAPLAAGGTTELLPAGEGVDQLAALIRERRTFCLLKLTPAHLELLLRTLPDDVLRAAARVVVVGGSALPPHLAREFLSVAPATVIVNEYGPTETVVGCCIRTIAAGQALAARVPIGRPVADIAIDVLDSQGDPVPPGAAGELYISGPQVGWGYLGQPALTAVTFLPDPHGPPGARRYRTGDRARMLHTGELDFLGRMDEQVKIRGYRIEPGDITTALRRHPLVADAYVTVAADALIGQMLVAYVVPLASSHVEPADLRAYLAERLPAYMVPAAVVGVPALPLTRNGKVDVAALPPVQESSFARAEFEAPATVTERALAAIWSRVLGAAAPGRGDDFFALGGDSLLATQVLGQVQQELGVAAPLRLIFDGPRLAAQAAAIDVLGADSRAETIPPRARDAQAGPGAPNRSPLSHQQQRLWFLHQLDPLSPRYHVPIALQLRGEVDVDALQGAVSDLVARHEALRTTFHDDADGSPFQLVAESWQILVTVMDLTELPYDDAEQLGRARASEQARAPFDLADGPLLRVELIRLAPAEHLLAVTIHHIVSDGWSVGVLLRDFGASYRSRIGDPNAAASSALPDWQYRDYVRHQRASGAAAAAALDWWVTALRGPLPLLELPTDRPRPAVASGRGGQLVACLPDGLAAEVKRYASARRVTPFAVLLAGYAAMLHGLTRQDEVVIGVPAANRMRPEVRDTVGFFVNMLPVRLRTDGAAAFDELAAAAHDLMISAADYQDASFEQIVAALGADRDAARSPLFQTIFALQNMPGADLDFAGNAVTELPVDTGTTRYELTLLVEPRPTGWLARLEYDADLFDAESAARIVDRYVTLTRAAVLRPDTAVADLPMLAAPELRRLADNGRGPRDLSHRERTVLDMLAGQARRTPDAIAVRDGAEQLTYAELSAAADTVATMLAGNGVCRGDRVALLASRSARFVAAVLGIWRAGAAYVPMDPNYPADRLAHTWDRAGARVLIEDPHTAPVVSVLTASTTAPVTRISLGASAAALVAATGPFASAAIGPADLAYVIFTSGSTGVPKGAMVEHAGMLNHLLAKVDDLRITGQDTILQNASACFDISVWQFFVAMTAGGTVRIASDDEARDPRALWQLAADSSATVLEVVPSLLRAALADRSLPAVPTLRWLVLTGEALPRHLVADWLRACPLTPIMNAYGPTECSDDVTHAVLAVAPAGPVPIGKPIRNIKLDVVDSSGRPAPLGSAGELAVGGSGVGRGYLGDPALTAERFRPDPEGPPGARRYLTGDLVRWLSSGELDFLGRLDHQVKVRGHRIELGDVEAALQAHPAVAAAVVRAHRDDAGENQLVAYVTGNGLPSAAELARFAAQRLPGSMVPAVIQALTALPLTANDKIDYAALPAPNWDEQIVSSARPAFIAPRTSWELAVGAAYEEVLGVPQVGADDDFFALGGHSLLAVQVITTLRARLSRDLPLRDLFDAPTVAALAARLALRPQSPASPPIRPAAGPVSLTAAQRRMWFFERLRPGTPVFNMPGAYRLIGDVEPSWVARALTDVIARHAVLRSTFSEQDGAPVARIAEPFELPLDQVDLRQLPADQRARRLAQLGGSLSGTAFDLSAGPLLRAALARVADREWMLFVTLHHLVADGTTVILLMNEVLGRYRQLRVGLPPDGAPAIQYADYAAWQEQLLADGIGSRQLDFWREQLAGSLPVLRLPADRLRSSVLQHAGAQVRHQIPASLAQMIRDKAAKHRASVFHVLLAGFKALMHRATGESDIIIGVPVDGRRHEQTRTMLGCFINTLPIRAVVDVAAPFADLISDVRDATLAALAHQDVPFERIVAELDLPRDLGHTPVFQVMFNMLDPADPLPDYQDLGFRAEACGDDLLTFGTKFELSVYARDRGAAGIELNAIYDATLFDAERVADLLSQFEQALAGWMTVPDATVGAVSLRTALAAARLADPSRPVEIAEAGSLSGQLSAHAAKCPGDLAASDASGEWTYAYVEDAAWLVADRIAAAGVQPGSVIAVYGARSAALMASVLGIRRAGAVVALIDPAYPEAALRQRIDTAGAVALLQVELTAPAALTAGLAVVTAPEHAEVHGAAGRPPRPPRQEALVDADAPAYITFTSGSTGEPKAVVGTERALARFAEAHVARYSISQADRISVLSGLAHDPLWRDLLTPLWSGAAACFPPSGLRGDGTALARWLCEAGVTVMHLTPSLAGLLAGAELPEGALSAVRLAVFGGEPLTGARCAAFRQLAPHARCVNGYGTTETPQLVASYEYVTAGEGTLPIGAGINGAQLLVVNPTGQLAGLGELGEIVIRSPYLAIGYQHDASLTTQRFASNPWRRDPEAADRIYRTGDLGRYRADGNVEFAGRSDRQLDVHGFRVEPAEVEAALLRIPGVTAAVVDADRGGVLAAFVAGSADPEFLRAQLAAVVPDYLVPSAFWPIDSVPLTSNGKIDYIALWQVAGAGATIAHPRVAPGSDAERVLHGIWSEVLEHSAFGVIDDFFAVGGHSLAVEQVLARIRREFGVDLPLATLFEATNIAALAGRVQDAVAAALASLTDEEIMELLATEEEQ